MAQGRDELSSRMHTKLFGAFEGSAGGINLYYLCFLLIASYGSLELYWLKIGIIEEAKLYFMMLRNAILIMPDVRICFCIILQCSLVARKLTT